MFGVATDNKFSALLQETEEEVQTTHVDTGRKPKREFDRQSGTGRDKGMKRGGGGAHNWGATPTTDALEQEAIIENDVAAEEAADEGTCSSRIFVSNPGNRVL